MIKRKDSFDMKSGKSVISIFAILALVITMLGAMVVTGTDRIAQAKETPLETNGRLSVKNGTIVNRNGKAFVIKGVSTHGLSWYPQYVNKKAFASLKKMGANTIRLAMYTEEYMGYCTGGKENQKKLRKLIDKGVKAATELGMYVIIDWHILSDGNPLTHKKAAKSFFKTVAKKYSGYQNVLYEICNEPNGGGGSWDNIRKYAKTMVKTIRSVNKKAIIIVGTPTWSQDLEQPLNKKVSGKNIVYAFHFYAATHKQDLRNRVEAVLKKGLPVLVTEFSLSEASGNGAVSVQEANKWMKLFNKYNVGRVCWNLSNKNETSSMIKSSCNKTSDWKDNELTKVGKWIKKVY